MQTAWFLVLVSALVSGCTAHSSSPSSLDDPEERPVRVSAFPSTVPGISIPNVHSVGGSEGAVLRGNAPWTKRQLEELVAAGVGEVLIFRNEEENRRTVEKELTLLRQEPGIASVVHIPMAWKDQVSFRESCEQTIAALRILGDRASRGGRAVYFHCTMGEDRTGYLAALYRIVYEGARAETVFRDEMCRWGYADGGPTKPGFIVDNVHAGLTRVFLKMVELHERGLLRAGRLDPAVCATDPAEEPRFRKRLAAWAPAFRCRR